MNFFNSIPNVEATKELGIQYRSQIKQSFLKYLPMIADKILVNVDRAFSISVSLDQSRRFNPCVYQCFFALRASLKKGGITEIHHTIQSLEQINKHIYSAPGFRTNSVLTDSWERVFVAKMRCLPLRKEATIRKDPRPMKGIFHATFVLARMLCVFNRVCKLDSTPSFQQSQERIAKWFDIGFQTVSTHAKLSQNGKRLLQSIPECIH